MLWCSVSADKPFTAFNRVAAETISPAVAPAATPAAAHVAHGLLLTPTVTLCITQWASN